MPIGDDFGCISYSARYTGSCQDATKGHAMTNLNDITDLDELLAAIHAAGHTDAEITGIDNRGAYTGDACIAIQRGDRLVRIWWDDQDTGNEGWAWSLATPDESGRPYVGESGALDSLDEIAALLPAHDAVARLRNLRDRELYDEVTIAGVECHDLTDAGVALAKSAGLTVDVDSYGCSYCVEASR